jgi:ABC-type uncharacterized transport system substrate-binding protein
MRARRLPPLMIHTGSSITAFTQKPLLSALAPAALSIERPTKIQLTINLKLAKRIGAEFSPEVLARADEVIE